MSPGSVDDWASTSISPPPRRRSRRSPAPCCGKHVTKGDIHHVRTHRHGRGSRALAFAMTSAPAAARVSTPARVSVSVVPASTVVSSPGTRHMVATTLTASPSPAAASRTIDDPRGDVARAQVDILSARIDTRTRLNVTLQFVTVTPSTSYQVSIDPGRARHGGWFSLVDVVCILRTRSFQTLTGRGFAGCAALACAASPTLAEAGCRCRSQSRAWRATRHSPPVPGSV